MIIFTDRNRLIFGIITFVLSVISVVLLPVYYWYLPPFLILWGVLEVVDIKNVTYKYLRLEPKRKYLLLLFISFFLWQLAGMIYTENISEGWKYISYRLSLFLFPLVLFSPSEKIRKNIPLLLRVFAISTFFFILVCLSYSLYRSLSLENGIWIFNPYRSDYDWLNYFYGSDLAIFHHPSYLSMYILFSVFIALEEVFNKNIKITGKVFWLILIALFMLTIYLLSSRAMIVGAVLTIPVYIAIKLGIRKINLKLGIAIVGVIVVLGTLFVSNPRLNRLIDDGSGSDWSTIMMKESRISIWKASFNIIKRNLLVGVGTGDFQQELNEEYNLSGNNDLTNVKDLNTHNQFIEVLLENGIIGLAMFAAIFILMFAIAINDRNILYLMFEIIIIISFMFEAMLNRFAGVSFFAMFAFMLLHYRKSSEETVNGR